MTIDEIKELIRVVHETGIAELELQRGNDRVRISSGSAKDQKMVMPTVVSVPVSGASFPTLPPVQTPETPAPPSPSAAKESDRDQVVKSPIVGTYYDAPAPGAAPFVKVGDRIEPKQVLCIIESMKLMNEIEAEFPGTLVAKHVENARPVEYGETLFTIRPD
ncbi:MAG TPA: acetyl-CoA carboxylase biotin carboxyl carrier protein [Bryobacteraceae bacterium]|jgi:acetyl-CoA carboxylase biotin carboxyl carrier protein|nr:acetyl-CoA carboxylase biotin carboxyl carrier protein [Bryobacteraceae bacterium]